MTEPDLPEAKIKSAEVSSGRRIPTVWIIPLVALLIGGWLVVKSIADKGPTISITFETAEGLEAGKTEIRYRDVQIGMVKDVVLDPDKPGVIVTAEMKADVDQYLTDTTQFWVVRPRFGVKEISGLGTLVAGAYVEIAPGEGGEPQKKFTGLELPPAIRSNAPGKEFVLLTEDLGALSRGSPIYHKGIDVGEVLGYRLGKENKDIQVRIFVNAPYDELVRKTTRFWNVSGFHAKLGAGGVELATSSLQALVLGGVNFSTPTLLDSMEKAPELTKFQLFEDESHIAESQITEKYPAIMYFEESLRGLSAGAPVEFRGVRLGTVKDYRLEFDPETMDYRMPVLIEFEPQRMTRFSKKDSKRIQDDEQSLEKLVAVGMRAKLQTSSFLTGEKFVELDFQPNTQATFYGTDNDVIEIPTVPSDFSQIASSATELLQKLTKAVDGAQKVTNAPELLEAVKNLNKTMVAVEHFTRDLNTTISPEASATLSEAHKTLATLRRAMDEQSPLRYDMETMMRELSAAARAVRNVATYLERNPSALITGKKGDGK